MPTTSLSSAQWSHREGGGEKPMPVSHNDHKMLLKKKHSSHPFTGRRNICLNLGKEVHNRPDTGDDSKPK